MTGAHLASLAASKPEGRLATLDKGLAEALSDMTELLPRPA
ncbi:MAG TPA: hypothetical protein VFQ96_01120 [Microbacteriaceae bacterium]|nr:hypothetical protein [Microbacteriaceae bacterium]